MFESRLVTVVTGILLIAGLQSVDQIFAYGDQEIILVTPNLDDDDRDGRADATDSIINGPQDRRDLTPIQLPVPAAKNNLSFSGSGADLYRVLEITESSSGGATVWIEAKGPKSSNSMATLVLSTNSLTNASREFQLNIRPFVLSCNVDPVSEVFISDLASSIPVIKQLEAYFEEIPNAPKLTVVDKGGYKEIDEWIQDTSEIGSFLGTSIHAAIAGLRSNRYWPVPGCLDRRFSEIFSGPDRCVLKLGDALPHRAYIDWFGNLERTPPCVGPDGRSFPMGRILTGRQKQLSMHDEVMAFLKDQEIQWPPIVLDTSFLWVGHVDEIVNFIPTDTGFKALIASPSLGRKLFEDLRSQGHRDAVILQNLLDKNGNNLEITVSSLLHDLSIMKTNDAAAETMTANRQKLMHEMNLDEDDVIDLPIIFMREKGEPVWPNPVNGIVINNHYIVSKPHGPIVGGEDAIEEAYREAFAGTDTILHFVDAWDALSKKGGDIHCGTNTVRYRLKP